MKRLLHHPESSCFFVAVPTASDYEQGVDEADPTLLPAGTSIHVGLSESLVLPSMDFETYSEAGFNIDPQTGKVKGVGATGKGGLPVVGTPNYACHDSTEVLCLYYDLKDGKGRRAWYPGFPDPVDLIQHIMNGGLIEAWNVTFEYWIWNMVCVRRYGWPPLPLPQCRCAMAKSRRHSLPGALGKAAKVLGTLEKDKEGGRLIQRLTRPHTPTKKRLEHRWTPATAWDDFLKFYQYCDVDVQTEDHASSRIPDLSPREQATWLVDQTINVRGVPVDIEALDAMLDILGQTERKYTMELSQITGGAVVSVSEVAKFGVWLASVGCNLPDMKKETVSQAIEDLRFVQKIHEGKENIPNPSGVYFQYCDVPECALRALEIRDTLGAANVKKLRTLKLQVSGDGRLRDQYMYCGADRTGRWSAGGVQLQNITSKGPKSAECESCGVFFNPKVNDICPACLGFMFHEMSDWTVEAVESAIRCILHRNLNLLEGVWGDPIAVLCGCLRGLFLAEQGKDFICCDFSAIEAVAAACLARCQWRIEVFNGHAKIYEQSASNATGIPFQEILDYKKQNGMHHPARKTIGKVRELAGGYGGWINAWKNFGADQFMNDDEIKIDVLKWREESPEIVEMWGGQHKHCGPGRYDYRPELYGLEGAAINAILYPGQCFSHIDITYGVWDDILFCRLPSGRFLHYHRPRLANSRHKLTKAPEYQITFEGYNSNSTKGPIGWHRLETYGGRLFENVVQAVALDVQAEALLRCEANGYPIVMHTHDEGIAEVPEGFGSADEMAAIMSERPEWASWWPLRAAGWRHKRYQKD